MSTQIDIVMDENTRNLALKIKSQLWNLWRRTDPKIKTKFDNLNGKTGQYYVPDILFQKRTPRYNRVLLPWKVLFSNNITMDMLKTFYGGVCVEFVNEDYLSTEYNENSIFNILKKQLGSDEKVSSIISFRTEDGDSGATIPRRSFLKFKEYYGKSFDEKFKPVVRKGNIHVAGKGDNSVWEGNIYYSIKGGSQETINSHDGLGAPKLFNPATEYANEEVCIDIDITMSYFAMLCFDIDRELVTNFNALKLQVEEFLKTRVYDEGNLYDYCVNHPSLKFGGGFLVDPIRLNKISIQNFKTTAKDNEDSCVISHNEAANKNIFYYDSRNKCILSPARPTNLFWSTHLSNMMQQNYKLNEYFEEEEKRIVLREKMFNV